jgi:hypothetical protein
MLVSIRRVFAVASLAVVFTVAVAGLVSALPTPDDDKIVTNIVPEGRVTPNNNGDGYDNVHKIIIANSKTGTRTHIYLKSAPPC